LSLVCKPIKLRLHDETVAELLGISKHRLPVNPHIHNERTTAFDVWLATHCDRSDLTEYERKLALDAWNAAISQQFSAWKAPPTMLGAFRTTESSGNDSEYRMVFKFRTLNELQIADQEWVQGARAVLPTNSTGKP
jgi:hypothetical protein